MFDRFVAFRARQSPHAVAVSMPNGDVSFAQFDLSIGRIAAALAEQGKPDLAAVCVADPYLQWLLTLALARLGIASSTVAPGDERRLLPILRPDLAIGDRPEALGSLPGVSRVLHASADWAAAALARTDALATAVRSTLDPGAPGRIFTSSGSTGAPKVIALSWRMVETRVHQMALRYGPTPCLERVLSILDAGNGAFVRALAAWGGGGTLILASRDPATLAGALTQLRPTSMLISPLQLGTLLDALPRGFLPLPRLRVDVSGSHLPPALRRAAQARLTSEIAVSYASTEAGSVAQGHAALVGDDPAACGWIFPWVDAEAVDDGGRAVPPGRQGEIRLRGPGIAAGYRDDPDLTARQFRDGWYHTGDVGTVSALGALRIEGRADDRMNFGGVKMLPHLIEETALSCPGVTDAAAFAAPGRDGLDEPWLALVRETRDDAALGAALQARLPGLPPVRVSDVASIPRNPNGKVERARLRAAASALPRQG